MDPIYLIIVIVLLVLAALDLTVGVANDAVNFLNSSIGSKVAPLWVILTVASVGVMLGTLFSSGMMEIARSGVFNPHMFTFPNIMMLFLAVMITDVILLDIFNTFGMPTSTTVSLVSGLLGAAVAVSLYSIAQNDAGTLSEYINTSKVLAIFSGILISVAVAFLVGSLVMYITRSIFSFNYHRSFKFFGAIWGGFALTAITYFAVFKGLKGSAFVSKEFLAYLGSHMGTALLYAFLGWTLLMGILQHIFRVNILRVIVLAGTLALALAFASNDLVNFIGVFMAGMSSYEIASGIHASGGDINTLFMDRLSEPVVADWRFLVGSGVIMIMALWFSKKSRSVTKTEVNLARQGDGVERFDSSPLSRALVRSAVSINKGFQTIMPARVRRSIDNRFVPMDVEDSTVSFDLIRASVNLTMAALLISLGTSLKLPLSTTYVTFMVAMGTSLADRAWGRESAVYRINGVLTVIGGWFFTFLAAFSIALVVGLFLVWGGKIAIAIMVAFVIFLFIKSAALHKKRTQAEEKTSALLATEGDVVKSCISEVKQSINSMLDIYEKNIVGLTSEDRKLLKQNSSDADDLYLKYKNKRTYEVVPTIQTIAIKELEIEQEYVQIVDYTYEITKALKMITNDSYRYIDNNHKGFSDEQEEDLRALNDRVVEMFESFIKLMNETDYNAFRTVVIKHREDILEMYAKLTKKQIKRVKAGLSGTRSSILFLNILNETKNIVLQAVNLMKSQRDMMLLQNGKKDAPKVIEPKI